MTVDETKTIWERYPDHRVELVPCRDTVRVWHGDRLLAESDSCIRVVESKHVERLYFPEADVRWEYVRADRPSHDLSVQGRSQLLDPCR